MQPQRILMTADAVGGVWRYAVDLGRTLSARGVRTTLAVMGPSPTAAQRAEAGAADIDLIERPYRLEWMNEPWADVELAGTWLLDLERRLNPALVHLNGYVHAALPWRSPVVVVAHSCVRTWWRAVRREAPPPPHLHRYTAAVRAGLAAAHVVVAPSSAMAAGLELEYGVPVTVRVIPNGLDPAPGSDDVGAEKKDVVLAAGRVWDEAKNIAALGAVAESIEWPLYVAGDPRGPDGRASELAGIRLLGCLPRDELARWYRRASIYALPARYEPFGLSVLEAAAAGCALVLGDIPSLRENWDGAALFVPPGDRDLLLAALRRLIERRDERTALAARARTRAAAFALDRTADQYLELYQALMA